MEDTKIQWHPGFVAAMNLEFKNNKEDLTFEKGMADSILKVSINANKQLIKEMMEDGSMYESLMELMEPRLLLRDKIKIEEGLQQGIKGTVEVLREFGHKDSEIKAAIIKKYGLSEETAEKYL